MTSFPGSVYKGGGGGERSSSKLIFICFIWTKHRLRLNHQDDFPKKQMNYLISVDFVLEIIILFVIILCMAIA